MNYHILLVDINLLYLNTSREEWSLSFNMSIGHIVNKVFSRQKIILVVIPFPPGSRPSSDQSSVLLALTLAHPETLLLKLKRWLLP